MKRGSVLIPVLLVALVVTIIIAVSCNKSNSNHPTLTLESINTTVQVNDSLHATFKFTGGATISNGIFWAIRDRINQSPPSNTSGGDTNYFQLPTFTANTGEITFSLPWQGYLNETYTQNDTDLFKFYVQNADTTVTSDTVKSPQIVVLYQ